MSMFMKVYEWLDTADRSAINWADSSPPRFRRGFLGPRRTLAESAAGPIDSAEEKHTADPPEVHQKSVRICADPRRTRVCPFSSRQI